MPNPKGDAMRGLAVFISDIRNCKSKEAEIKRINKELANVRSKFKGDRTLDGYQKKKYVCKLLFIFLLGHDIDFGYTEAVNLLCSNRYTEKQIGYLFISVLIHEAHPLTKLVINRLMDDMSSRNVAFVNLALQCVANIGSREMAEQFANEVPKLLVSGETTDSIKQNAALCLLRFIRVAPDLVTYGEWTSRAIHLLNDHHLGVVTSAVSLIEALVKRNPEEYKGCVSLAVSRLSRLITSSYNDLQDYTYYFVTAPWLSVKLLRLLQNYPPPEENTVRTRLNECLETILKKVQEPPKSKKVQHPNAKNAVLFEAINLIIHLDCDPKLLVRACNQLGQFLQHKETNLRYLALESLCLLATSEFSHEAVKKHQETIVNALKSERDVSVRQRAVDLLYAMCDGTNAQAIVSEMLSYLETADYSIREEMVLKVAILAEKYATGYTWYVDTFLTLIRVAGDYVSDEVWHRVVQIVVNRDDVQGYAAKTAFEALQAPACHENMVKIGGYVLGEFGNLIAGDPRSSPKVQFELLHSKYHLCTPNTRQLLLSTYVKFINLFPEIKGSVQEVLRQDSNCRSSTIEIQQRSVEYLALSNIASEDVLATVLEEMPPFPERESSILAKLKSKKPVIEGQTTAKPGRAAPKGILDRPPLGAPNDGQLTVKDDERHEKGQTAEADLLGIGFTPAVANGAVATSQPTASSDLLDILGNGTSDKYKLAMFETPELPPHNLYKFISQPNGVLLETDLLQIGLKSEYANHMGRLTLFYGNKSTTGAFTDVQLDISNPKASGEQLPLVFDVRPSQTSVAALAQMQQLVNIECFSEFAEVPIMTLSFSHAKGTENVAVRLPVFLSKFMQPASMDQATYINRWKLLCQPGQECQKVYTAKQRMDPEEIKAKILGFGLSCLPSIDPSPNNFVGAGVVHFSNNQVGVLTRIEPNYQSVVYRITIRSTMPEVSTNLCNLMLEQL